MEDHGEATSMKNDEHFWWTTLVRGFLAVSIGSVIMVVPDMAKSLLLLPLAMVAAILGLAVYGVLDSVLVFVTSYMAESRPAKIALRIQGVIGVTVGVFLYLAFFDQVRLYWFLILISVQAFSTAVGEFLVAKHSRTSATSHWNFTAAAAALCFGCTYFCITVGFADQMAPQQISWLLFAYLLVFGIAQCLTAARMLYSDQQLRPVHDEALVVREA
jgi:uncharacterized membrane protein HdeD (DUF308 family)